ncbi:MAG: tRNA (adenosine(37)-N6)-threonylcarbamoyltransferase complex transferase subunit TsaD [bacterium]
MRVLLAIETSCDETAAAVVRDGTSILGNALHSQIPDHHKYGGVVPEIASRRHIETIIRIIAMAMDEATFTMQMLDGIAITVGPGLIGSLLVGLSAAKAIAFAADLPLIPVDHLEGHIYASILTCPDIPFPFVSLVVSGGHTDLYLVKGHGEYELLGRTRDDAAGEAFDKVAKFLGLGYPGGPVIDELARTSDPHAITFPRAYLERDSLDFSFSGLKTAVCNHIRFERDPGEGIGHDSASVASIVAGFQEAVVDVLVSKAMEAVKRTGVHALAVGGGVASNSRLRERLDRACRDQGITIVIPPPRLCVDNACMIGAAGFFNQGRATRDWSITAQDTRVWETLSGNSASLCKCPPQL